MHTILLIIHLLVCFFGGAIIGLKLFPIFIDKLGEKLGLIIGIATAIVASLISLAFFTILDHIIYGG